MSERKPYPSDLSDERWALIEPVITAWKAAHPSVSGHQGRYEMREIVNAILYQRRTGCQWDYLPHDLPPRSAVYYYFAKWRDDGTDQTIHDLLRWQTREKRGRLSDPSLVVLDTQSIRAAAAVPSDTTGNDAGKRTSGRKRGLAVDVLGLVVAVVVLAASVHENTAAIALLDRVAAQTDTVQTALVDQGFEERGRRPRRLAGHRRGHRRTQPGRSGVHPPAQAVGGRANLGHPGPAPPPGPRLRTPPSQLRIARVLGDERRDGPAADQHLQLFLARHMSGHEVSKPLLEAIEVREQALTHQAEQARAQIDELTVKLGELNQAIDHLQITRATLLSLADEDDAEPAVPPPALPEHPAYQQIMTAFADLGRPLRARDLCQALDLPIVSKNTENIRSKLKRLVSRGILNETEPGLFTQPRP